MVKVPGHNTKVCMESDSSSEYEGEIHSIKSMLCSFFKNLNFYNHRWIVLSIILAVGALFNWRLTTLTQ